SVASPCATMVNPLFTANGLNVVVAAGAAVAPRSSAAVASPTTPAAAIPCFTATRGGRWRTERSTMVLSLTKYLIWRRERAGLPLRIVERLGQTSRAARKLLHPSDYPAQPQAARSSAQASTAERALCAPPVSNPLASTVKASSRPSAVVTNPVSATV